MKLVQIVTNKETGKKVKYTLFESKNIKALEKFQEEFIQQGLENGWTLLSDAIGLDSGEYKIQVVICDLIKDAEKNENEGK